jgi:uncharacterized protein YecE (DUF72 family)
LAKILIGTCSWADPELIRAGTFYPPNAKDAESRLRYYTSQFPLVEVDSAYYAIPDQAIVQRWAERTPPGFVFDAKAFSLFTLHPTQRRALPKDIAAELAERQTTVYYSDLPHELQDEAWAQFRAAFNPLYEAGKLGVILLQFPRWVAPTAQNRDYILEAQGRLNPYGVAIEFRNEGWLVPARAEETLSFLREHRLPLVCVDEPQGFVSSVPPLAEATADLVIARFHGRNAETWEQRGIKPSQRFDWYYQEAELREWLPRIQQLAELVGTVHLLVNTNHRDQGIVNARLLQKVLARGCLELAQTTGGEPPETSHLKERETRRRTPSSEEPRQPRLL